MQSINGFQNKYNPRQRSDVSSYVYITALMNRIITIILTCLAAFPVYAQNPKTALLLNASDSTVIGGAVITLLPFGKTVVTNAGGEFALPDSPKDDIVRFAVAGIGIRDTVQLRWSGEVVKRVFVRVETESLENFVLHSLSAEDVVRKAIDLIPDNYACTSYFCFSSYRQYQRKDSDYVNLVEAQPVVMMNITANKGGLHRTEAYAAKRIRRSNFVSEPGNAYDINPADLLADDPVYHISDGSLEPRRLFYYSFRFDTLHGSDTNYVVLYRSDDYSPEKHGIENLKDDFRGESWEYGSIVIDRYSFAIRRFTRESRRHESYNYPKYNNFVRPAMQYYVEFSDGSLVAEYEQMGSKWYVKRLCHRFTNDFRGTGRAMTRDVRLTNYYEWRADSMSRYTTDEYAGAFFNKMYMWPASYDELDWKRFNLPFYYGDSTSIYAGLGKARGEQFRSNTKVREPATSGKIKSK